MAEKDRLNGAPFTCSNRRFHTDTQKGKPHGQAEAMGSVFDHALLTTSNDQSLWLEYVTDKQDGSETFWLMWYDDEGSPSIPMSGVISLDQIREMSRQLAGFINLDGQCG